MLLSLSKRYCHFAVLTCLVLAPETWAKVNEGLIETASETVPEAAPVPVTGVAAPGGQAPATDQPAEQLDEIAGAALGLFEREGRGVRIQGLGHTRTELNGREVFSVPNGHALSWSDVSREWMAGVDSYKSPDASMVEGGLGGTVNIRTRKPLELDDSLQQFSIEAAYGELSQRVSPQVSYLASGRKQTPVGEFGALISLLGENSYRRQDSVELEPFIRRGDLSDTDVWVPRGVKWRVANNAQRQHTIGGVLQWSPGPGTEVSWQSLISTYDNSALEYSAGFKDAETALVPQAGTGFRFNEQGIFQSGQLWSNAWRGEVPGNSVRLNGTTKVAERQNRSWEHALAFTFAPASSWALRGDVQYLGTSTEVLDFTVYTSTYVPDLYLDISGSQPVFATSSSAFLRQPSNYFWNAAMDHLERGEADYLSGRLDGVFDLDRDFSIFTALMVGARLSEDHTTFVDAGYNWGSLSDLWNLPLRYLPENSGHLAGYRQFDDFFMGDTGMAAGFYFPRSEFVSDYQLASQTLPQITSGEPGSGWQPDQFSWQDENSLERSSQALYSMLLFEDSPVSSGAISGHVGVRLVANQRSVSGFGKFSELETDAASIDPAELAFANGDFYQLRNKSQQLHWLPSGYVRWDFDTGLVWRMAASRTLIRPDFYQLRSYSNVWAETETLALDGGGSQTLVKRWRGSAGNPELSPVRVQQYDTAFEWQFSENGNLYSALFYKQLSDAIEKQLVTEAYSNNGETRDVEVEKLQNGGVAEIRGLELGVSQRLGFLPGALRNVAVHSIFTHIDSESSQMHDGDRLPLEGLAENHLSLSGTYQNRFFSTTFNYHWRDDVLNTALDANTNRPKWQKAWGRLDASVAVPLDHGLQLALEAQNLTNTLARTEYGGQMGAGGDELTLPGRWDANERHWRLILRGRY